jgi:hypothetical protein
MDLALLRGVIAADRLRLAPSASTRDENGHLRDEDVVIAWERLAVNLRWLALLDGEIGMSEVRLDRPAVNIVRNDDDSINLVQLFTPPDDAESVEPDEDAEAMPVSIDRLTIGRGRISFDDRTVSAAQPLVWEIGEMVVDGFSWPLPADGNDAGLALDLVFDGAVLTVRGSVAETDDTLSLSATLDAENLRMVGVRAYAGALGWADVRGLLDAHVRYELIGSEVHNVKGTLALRHVAIALPDDDRVPLRLDSLVLADMDVDLAARRVALGEVTLKGGHVRADPKHGLLLPVIVASKAEAAGAESESEVQSEPADPADPADDDAEPWSWSLGKVDVADLSVLVLTDADPLRVGVTFEASEIGSEQGRVFPVKLALVVGEGSFDVEGDVRIAPPAAALKVDWKALELVRLASALPTDDARMLRSGKSAGNLRIGAGLPLPGEGGDAAAAGPNDLVVAGQVLLGNFEVDLQPSPVATAGFRSLDAQFRSIIVPGFLSDDAAKKNAGPISVVLDKLVLSKPSAHLIIDAALSTEPELAAAATAADSGVVVASTEVAGDAVAPLNLVIEGLDVRDARIQIDERNVATPFAGTITAAHIRSRLVAWPQRDARGFEASGTALKRGTWSITGDVTDADGKLDIELSDVPLVPLSALTDDVVGLTIRRGAASLTTTVRVAGDSFDSRNNVTAHDLDLYGDGAEQSFSANFGLPLTLALALLKDPGGDISLDLPLSVKRGQTTAGLTTAVAGVMREAIIGAVTTPLKLIGSVVIGSGKVKSFSLEPVDFAPGSADFEPASAAALEALATMVKSRPGLALEFHPVIVAADVRALKEAALLEAFDADTALGAGVPDVSWLQKRRLRAYLEAELAGNLASLEPEDAELLTAVLAARPSPRDALASLVAGRIAGLESALRDQYGLLAEQIAAPREADLAESRKGLPRMEFVLAAAGD